jgi:hypothetical protein
MGEFTMRCLACNALMSDFEATRKSVNTNEYIDLCNHCYYSISDDVNALERTDLEHEEDMVVADDFTDTVDLDVDNLD